MTKKQDPTQSIDTFVHELQTLAKGCNFADVTAEQNRSDYVPDALIQGIYSTQIRQRLLENNTLHLNDAISKARSMEQAQTQSQSFESQFAAAALDTESPDQTNLEPLTASVSSKPNQKRFGNRSNTNSNSTTNNFKCYNCGRLQHSRNNCPARNSNWRNCGKRGHWAEVCRSPPSTFAAAINDHDHNSYNNGFIQPELF